MKILTAAQVGEVDRLTTERYRIPSILLMENAGRSVADAIAEARPDFARQRIVILCGGGNNGGDGFVAARYLALRGASPTIVLLSDPANLRGDARTNWDIAVSMQLSARVLPTPAGARACLRKLPQPDIIVDALFGTGLSKPIGPGLKPVVEWINEAGSRALVAAVDIPSGIYADSPAIAGPAVRADLTVTFSALKLAHVIPPAADRAGKVVLAQIGSPPELYDNPEYRYNLIDAPQVRRVLPPRERAGHKGTYGHVHIVAGSRGKSGAALMTGLAALRSGAGLATLWTPESLRGDIAGRYPELMMEPLPETADGTSDASGADLILAAGSSIGSLVVGPGLGTHPSTGELVRELVRRAPAPVVVDADGIRAFAPASSPPNNRGKHPVVLTPHPGEMAQAAGTEVSAVQSQRLETACRWARTWHCYVVLKGFQTVVATPAGDAYINRTGNPGMATGGTGDVLAGMVGRFMAAWNRTGGHAARVKPDDFICAAVYRHGLAGDLAAEGGDEESLVATDLFDRLPEAFRRLRTVP